MTTPEPLGGGSQESLPASLKASVAQAIYGAEASRPPKPPFLKSSTGFARAALFVGIGAFLLGFVPVLGAIVGAAAIVLGILAIRKTQPKGFAITGIILGGIALMVSIGVTASLGAVSTNATSSKPAAVVAQATPAAAPAPKPVETTTPPQPTPTPEPAKVTQPVQKPAPVEVVAPVQAAEPKTPAVPAEYKSALSKAGSYANMMSMSKAGVYDQLTSSYGEKFSAEAAQFAIDNVQSDWNANALAKAKSYQDNMSMSPSSIRDQLTSSYGEKFTASEADYAIQHLNG